MQEVKRIEVILDEVKNTIEEISLHDHLSSCQKLLENGWSAECDAIPALRPLKPFFNDPLKAIFAKLFLLKFLCHVAIHYPHTLTDGANWIEHMQKNVGAQFTLACSDPNQHVTYNGKHIHTFEALEQLAQQRSGPRPFIDSPALVDQETAYNCFKLVCLLNAIHMSTRYFKLHHFDDTQYAIQSAFLLTATIFIGAEMNKRGAHIVYNLSEDAVQNNIKLQVNCLISTQELNQLKNQRNLPFLGIESLIIGAILQQLIRGGITSNPNVIGLPLLAYGFASLLKLITPISALVYDRFFRPAPQAQPNNAAMQADIIDDGDPRVVRRTEGNKAGKASKKG